MPIHCKCECCVRRASFDHEKPATMWQTKPLHFVYIDEERTQARIDNYWKEFNKKQKWVRIWKLIRKIFRTFIFWRYWVGHIIPIRSLCLPRYANFILAFLAHHLRTLNIYTITQTALINSKNQTTHSHSGLHVVPRSSSLNFCQFHSQDFTVPNYRP